MKFLRKMVAVLFVIGLMLSMATGCVTKLEREFVTQQNVYLQAVALGYEGTLEEFIVLVSGKDGQNGKDGASVTSAYVNEQGELIISLSDGSSLNAGSVKGRDGVNGVNGVDGVSGADGKDGSVWILDEGIPSESIGKTGDFYLDQISCEIYYKAESGWIPAGTLKGRDGQDGADGKDGSDGINGADGQDGENGKDGKDGQNGAGWLIGAGIPLLEAGNAGDLYLDAETYDVYIKIAQTWQLAGNIKGQDGINGTDGQKGEDGRDGADGTAWIFGAGTPRESTGKEGDFYLDSKTFDVYRKEDNWVLTGNIKGKDALSQTITVSYDAAGGVFENGAGTCAETVVQGGFASLPLPTRENALFAGWYGGSGANLGKMTAFTPVTADILLTAKWMPVPKSTYSSGNAFQVKEGEALPRGDAVVENLYNVLYARCFVNGAESNAFTYTAAQDKLGEWNIAVTNEAPAVFGSYEVAVVLYCDYTEVTVSFHYNVSAALVHEFTGLLVSGATIADNTISLEAFDSCDISFVLDSTYESFEHTLTVGQDVYALAKENNLCENEEYNLQVKIMPDLTITVNAMFYREGAYQFSFVSKANDGATATINILFTVI